MSELARQALDEARDAHVKASRECGGVVCLGHRDQEGHSGGAQLSFDNVEQDQVIVLNATDQGSDGRVAKLEFLDQPEWTMTDLARHTDGIEDAEERRQATLDFVEQHGHMTRRMRLAREADGSVGLTLRDDRGRPRLVIEVCPDGTPRIQLLDEHGRVH